MLKILKIFWCLPCGFLLLISGTSSGNESDWITQSDKHTDIVLGNMAKFEPERAGGIGVGGVDDEILDLRANLYERRRTESLKVLVRLEVLLKKEKHPKIRQDLAILKQAVKGEMRSHLLNRTHQVPYFNVSQIVYSGVRSLIDSQVSHQRYPSATTRIRRYAGMEKGMKALTELAKARTRERLRVKGLIWPYRVEVQQDIDRTETFIDGIEALFVATSLEGWQQAFVRLSQQLRDYARWVRTEILPRAREDFRLLPELYEDSLRIAGVNTSIEQLIQNGSHAYLDIRNEMEVIGALVAKQHDYPFKDYRKVIQRLRDQGTIDGDKLLGHYQLVLSELEEIVRKNNLVGIPDRSAGIRIATVAESAALPAAHLDVPRLKDNKGALPYFVVPNIPRNLEGSWPHTDYNYEAGLWTLTAHEARPGHELQYSTMIENGLSLARVVFAFNSVNVEGWALYAEAITKPYMPLEGQLISLQYRLLRAARMFLDPMLHKGRISPEEAKRLLLEDIVIEETWAQDEIERYTYRSPGQATAYYYGYAKMQSLRTQTELALREQFDQKAFHNFILDQGLLPPQLLKKAVMEEFVPDYADR